MKMNTVPNLMIIIAIFSFSWQAFALEETLILPDKLQKTYKRNEIKLNGKTDLREVISICVQMWCQKTLDQGLTDQEKRVLKVAFDENQTLDPRCAEDWLLGLSVVAPRKPNREFMQEIKPGVLAYLKKGDDYCHQGVVAVAIIMGWKDDSMLEVCLKMMESKIEIERTLGEKYLKRLGYDLPNSSLIREPESNERSKN